MSGASGDGRDLGWDEFMRVDMRVGRIVAVEDFPEARRPAWKLRVDFGEEIGVRRSSAQITNYSREGLVGRLVVAVVNFPPKQIGPASASARWIAVAQPGSSRAMSRKKREPNATWRCSSRATFVNPSTNPGSVPTFSL